MNQKSLTKLEFPKIIEMLTDHASSPGGASFCRRIKPMTDLNKIITAQEQTAAAFTRIVKKGIPSFSGCYAVSDSLKRLEIGSALSAPELLRIGKLLQTTARIKSYGRHENADDQADCLDVYFEQLAPLTPLSAEIDRCILGEDEISDDASSKLKQIRRSINGMNDKIHSTMTGLLNGSMRTYLQDAIITMRGDRYCLPVKAEYRSQVNGLIHDQSATGSTLFIEPMAVVKLNNDLKELYAQEQEEIQVILARLSVDAAEYIEEIRLNYKALVELDFTFAKGALALDMNASRPVFNTEGRIRIREGRHPLLDRKKVVPISLTLGDTFDLLVITGPNTGGKTVSLKTVGLFTLMGQAGLHIPALDRSELAVFNQVYADIGDEQSIEQSLSTFSSHMTNVVSFLNHVDENSLVLFDELGAGTDPTEGAALAMAILECLHQMGASVFATTHYSELKIFASTTSGFVNASCEFDTETLKPTYRLLIGVPGKSNAFAISQKLGLDFQIIERAKEFLTNEDLRFEDLLKGIEDSRKRIDAEKEETETLRRESERLREEIAREKEQFIRQKNDMISKTKEDARVILNRARIASDKMLSDLRRAAAELEKGKNSASAVRDAESTAREFRNFCAETDEALYKSYQNHIESSGPPAKLREGETVRILSLNSKGTVLKPPDKDANVYVQAGIMKIYVPLSDLRLDEATEKEPPGRKQRKFPVIEMKAATIKTELDVRGMTVEEAVLVIDRQIHDGILAKQSQFSIIHGKGTGALRAGIHNYLKSCKMIQSYRLGEFGEGDTGVTIVTLK